MGKVERQESLLIGLLLFWGQWQNLLKQQLLWKSSASIWAFIVARVLMVANLDLLRTYSNGDETDVRRLKRRPTNTVVRSIREFSTPAYFGT
jgi:hypothetical protein